MIAGLNPLKCLNNRAKTVSKKSLQNYLLGENFYLKNFQTFEILLLLVVEDYCLKRITKIIE